MISRLQGKLVDHSFISDKSDLTIDVGGVGYRVLMAPASARSLGSVGSEAVVWIHSHVREDAFTLFGFAQLEERKLFEALISAHGVGPSLALSILAVHAPPELRRIVATEDTEALCLVPGIGKKTAAKLLFELKSKIAPDIDLTAIEADSSDLSAFSGNAAEEVRAALTSLGYTLEETRNAISEAKKAIGNDFADDTQQLLRASLQAIATRR